VLGVAAGEIDEGAYGDFLRANTMLPGASGL
jgi:hypothetical protein